jgi:hypothetical protein
MSLNARERRRRERSRKLSAAEVRESLKALQASGLIATVDGAALPEDLHQRFHLILYTPEEALQRVRANADIYKTPAGNLIAMKMPDGAFDHWMTPAEAELWQVNAEAIAITRKGSKG